MVGERETQGDYTDETRRLSYRSGTDQGQLPAACMHIVSRGRVKVNREVQGRVMTSHPSTPHYGVPGNPPDWRIRDKHEADTWSLSVDLE